MLSEVDLPVNTGTPSSAYMHPLTSADYPTLVNHIRAPPSSEQPQHIRRDCFRYYSRI